jgi:hypothetical protein
MLKTCERSKIKKRRAGVRAGAHGRRRICKRVRGIWREGEKGEGEGERGREEKGESEER